MLHKLVVITQTSVIEDPIVIYDDGVIYAAASGKTSRAQVFKLMHKTESSSTADISHERLGAEVQRCVADLLLENRVIEINGKGDAKAIVRS